MCGKAAYCVMAMLLAILMPACNNDIFIDGAELPEYTDLTIEGDGGQWSAPYSRKGLAAIAIDPQSSQANTYLTYYDTDSKPVGADCPPAKLKEIVYENPKQHYSIGFSGDIIYITSYYNASPYGHVLIKFDYDYGVSKYINITFTEGEKLSMTRWTVFDVMTFDEDFEKTTHSRSLTNNTSVTQKLELRPFLESKCSDVAEPQDYWARDISLEMPMITFTGKGWEFRTYDDIRLGERRQFTPGWAVEDIISVDVPPHTKARVIYTIYYTRATQKGSLDILNSVDNFTSEVPVTWTSIYATRYDYKVYYE